MDAGTLRRLALALPGTDEIRHFDRTAFRARVIFATLAPDGLTANLGLSPEEQEFRCSLAPGAFRPDESAWGARGWTRATLAALDEATLEGALRAAWTKATQKPPRRRR